ncbi:hypothetical protein JTB14_006524 [Gonioctena quinquepunctata]|nr:hypothetical protein JTB14_006524 [Gonioctena quinquepunctata]
MFKIGGFAIICLIITLGYGIGLLKFLTEYQEDKCQMTYMFEYPQYVRIFNKADKKYRKYGLYAYSEGRLTEKSRNMYFDGIPVLFIPGNAGSHKQVRSLASVALRKSLNSRIPYHFDYFTVDLNEEFSGLYGPLLYDQWHYAHSCLHRILELYRQRDNKPNSVIIIGHSVGGIIALKLASDPKLVPLVITLATPLKRPALIQDYHLGNFHSGNISVVPEDTTVISLSGGYRDFLIPPFMTENGCNQSTYVVSTSVPLSWVETDHKQIVWCKQIVMALNRALFDSIDLTNRQISLNPTHRKLAFHHHLVRHSGINARDHDRYSETIKIDSRGKWSENVSKRYTLKYMRGVKETRWHMVSLSNVPGYDVLTILAVNLETVDWVFACNANIPKGSSRICSEAIHLTHLSEIAPSAKYKRRLLEIDMQEFRKSHIDLTHVVFRVLPTSEPVVFHVDIHSKTERNITVDLPKWWSLKRHIILEKTPEKSVNYNLVLPQLQHIIQYYYLYLEPIVCSNSDHHATASLISPWSHENFHGHVTNIDKKPVDIRLYSSKPARARHSSALIKLTLDPSCTYSISIKSSIPSMLGQMSRIYTPLLLTNMAAVTLMSLRFQLKSLEKGYCSILFVAINEGAKPYYVLTLSKILSQLLSTTKISSFLPKPDVTYLIDEGSDFFLLPLLLYLCSVGIIWMFAVVFCISLVAFETTVHKFTLKLLARSVSFNVAWSDYLLGVLHKVPFVVASALVLLSLTTCGGLALCLGAIFYFLRLTQMSQDFMEVVVWFFVKKMARKFKEFLRRKKPDQTPALSKGNTDRNGSRKSIDNVEQHENSNKELQGKEEEDELQGKEEEEELQGKKEEEKLQSKQEEEKLESKGEKKEQLPMTDPCISRTTDGDNNLEVAIQDVVGEQIEESSGSTENKTSEDYGELSTAYNAIFFHSTLFFLWCMVTFINVPAVLTWAHNFKYNTVLTPDDSFVPGFILSLCALTLWQFDFPRTDRKWLDKLGVLMSILAIVSLTFATISLYRLNYILTFAIAMVTLQQLLAPKEDPTAPAATQGDDSDDDKDKYDGVKSKME